MPASAFRRPVPSMSLPPFLPFALAGSVLLAACSTAPVAPPPPPPAAAGKPRAAAPPTAQAPASPPPAAVAPKPAPAPPAAFTPLPVGTRLTYLRRDVGSFGNGETRLQVTVGEMNLRGKRVVKFERLNGTTDLQEPDTGKLIAVLDASGQPAIVYDPPLGYETPLAVGKRWTSQSKATTLATRQSTAIEVRYQVQDLDEITVQAGTFRSWRLQLVDHTGEEQRVWISTDTGLALRRSFRRPATHPQGAGARDIELIARELPAQ